MNRFLRMVLKSGQFSLVLGYDSCLILRQICRFRDGNAIVLSDNHS